MVAYPGVVAGSDKRAPGLESSPFFVFFYNCWRAAIVSVPFDEELDIR